MINEMPAAFASATSERLICGAAKNVSVNLRNISKSCYLPREADI
jgi:hypothetical protein